jgi:capsular polysaccharide transport system permease protein
MSTSTVHPKRSLAASIVIQLRVMYTLVIRESQAGYSQETLGFFWTIGEPLILTVGVIFMWILHGKDAHHPLVTVEAMALSAYTHLQLWRRGVLPCTSIIKHSGWMLYHSRVRILDVIVSHVVNEWLSIFASFWLIYAFLALFQIIPPIRDYGLLISGYLLDLLWTASFGIFIAAVCLLNEFIEKITHPLMYLTLPLSGAFFLTDWASPRFQAVLVWSPMANAIEMFRAGMFSLNVKLHYSATYGIVVSLFMLAIALPLLDLARRRAVFA